MRRIRTRNCKNNGELYDPNDGRALPDLCLYSSDRPVLPRRRWRGVPDSTEGLQNRPIRYALLVVILGWAAAPPQASRKTLDQPTEIPGYACAKGYAWFYADGRLERCTVSRDTAFGEARVPAGSIIVLLPDGKPRYVMLIHDALIHGYKCAGGGQLGPSEGATTTFYPSGKLKLCWLAQDQMVQGIPCMAAGGFLTAIFHRGGFGTDFHENGKLHSCTLSRDFGGQRRGHVYTQGP